MSKHLRVYIDKLQHLPPITADPLVRVKVGNNSSETPVGTYVNQGEYDIATTVVFDHHAGQDVTLEILNSETSDVVAWLTIPEWRQTMKADKFKGLVKLRPEGVVRLDLRLFDAATEFPNRLDLVLSSATGLPDSVKRPSVKISLGERDIQSKVADHKKTVPGHFEWNESHTVAYNGERACLIQVIDENSTVIGICRYDLWEVLNNTKGNRKKAGRIALTDQQGFPMGNIFVAFALWDTKDAKQKVRGNLESLDALKQRREIDVKLFQTCREAVQQSDVRPLAETEKCLTQAGDAIQQADDTANLYDDPSMHKSDLAGIKKKLKKLMLDAERHLDRVEKYLQQVCHSAAAREWELGKIARGTINAAARDMASARVTVEKDAEMEELNTNVIEPLVREAEKQEEIMTERINAIQHTLHSPDMMRFYEDVREAVLRLEKLAADAANASTQINDRVRARRLAVRKQESIRQKALSIPGPIITRAAREPPSFPMCCCCWL
eukprot:Gregarina_sp_Poly_1__1584@NODE_13_length_23366_cov_172_320786_g11_i0_p3_GENE_NODE_13_length_23366_cov_172_320786_g11_i0NODE_13_length_23366_cov_172_320786_g11_i0_p3_ORF_typecomplete_len496_score73_42Ferritin/PF00210_24/0_03PCEMA1/PF07418_11/1DUF948/PF06103_11/3_9e03DUF948/PF06103_11/1_2e02DUF948/PF06103_11/14_NODE_13_length_23366_cov_172_320786_g11_i02183623323